LSATPPDPRAAKRALRRATVAAILALDPEERRRQESALLERVETLPGFDGARTVLLYAPAFPEEIDTAPLLRAALGRGLRLVLPRVDRARWALTLHPVAELARDLRPGTLGIPEPAPELPELDPSAIDWALVPGLAFDARGHRLGRGAGHYDRLLPRLRPEVPRWAIALEPQLVEALPVEPHDQPLDGVALPSGNRRGVREI
jgi:5-formyltetrahydrofolate cyclo-ligase